MAKLTEKKYLLLKYAHQGMPPETIAERMGLKASTVKNYIRACPPEWWDLVKGKQTPHVVDYDYGQPKPKFNKPLPKPRKNDFRSLFVSA